MLALTRAMALDHAKDGIRVNAICPGFIDTPMMQSVFDMDGMDHIRKSFVDGHALGRCGHPDEIAAAAAFLASDDASYVTGETLGVSGGLGMV